MWEHNERAHLEKVGSSVLPVRPQTTKVSKTFVVSLHSPNPLTASVYRGNKMMWGEGDPTEQCLSMVCRGQAGGTT